MLIWTKRNGHDSILNLDRVSIIEPRKKRPDRTYVRVDGIDVELDEPFAVIEAKIEAASSSLPTIDADADERVQ